MSKETSLTSSGPDSSRDLSFGIEKKIIIVYKTIERLLKSGMMIELDQENF
jgi:hypothetical protein